MSATGASVRLGTRELAERGLPRVVLKVALLLLGLMALGYLAYQLRPVLDRPIQAVRVSGHFQHTTPVQIAAAAAVAPGTRLFEANLQAIRTRVDALPWVARAQVARNWPSALTVQVVEHRPFARWGQHALVDRKGRIFRPEKIDLTAAPWKTMPRLSGPRTGAGQVMQEWKRLSAALQGGPFALASLTESDDGDWSAISRSGIVLRLGHHDPVEKLPLLRSTIPHALTGRFKQIAAIDLRYTNGFAVRWKKGDASVAVTHPARHSRP